MLPKVRPLSSACCLCCLQEGPESRWFSPILALHVPLRANSACLLSQPAFPAAAIGSASLEAIIGDLGGCYMIQVTRVLRVPHMIFWSVKVLASSGAS